MKMQCTLNSIKPLRTSVKTVLKYIFTEVNFHIRKIEQVQITDFKGNLRCMWNKNKPSPKQKLRKKIIKVKVKANET